MTTIEMRPEATTFFAANAGIGKLPTETWEEAATRTGRELAAAEAVARRLGWTERRAAKLPTVAQLRDQLWTLAHR